MDRNVLDRQTRTYTSIFFTTHFFQQHSRAQHILNGSVVQQCRDSSRSNSRKRHTSARSPRISLRLLASSVISVARPTMHFADPSRTICIVSGKTPIAPRRASRVSSRYRVHRSASSYGSRRKRKSAKRSTVPRAVLAFGVVLDGSYLLRDGGFCRRVRFWHARLGYVTSFKTLPLATRPAVATSSSRGCV